MSIIDYIVKRKIPKEIFDYDQKIMHITDTPDVIYPFLRRLIRIVKPDVVIHTGDIVDNIKLEFSPTKIGLYEKKLKVLMTILKDVKTVYYCVGNHDDETLIKKYLYTHSYVVKTGVYQAENCKLAFAHQYKDIHSDADFKLFGHCPIDIVDQTLCNGLNAIYMIDGKSKRRSEIPYPRDIDDFRLKKHSLGL